MITTHHYCTYFDHRYLVRALALYHSLKRHDPSFCLWALCFDDQAFEHLQNLGYADLRPISLEAFTRRDEALIAVREHRSLVEYYFTCSPSLPLYVFKHAPQVDQVTYIDSDLYFFHDPQPVFNEIGSSSIAIIAHRFPACLKPLEAMGIFNVGWLTFKRDEEGLACLERWRAQCLEWCFDRVEGTRYADQGYLNEWPALYKNLVVLQQKGADLAPWNLAGTSLKDNGGTIWVDQDPLVFFHFQSLARLSNGAYKLNFHKYRLRPSRFVREKIYAPYLQELEALSATHRLSSKDERLRAPGDTKYLLSFQRGAPLIPAVKSNLAVLRDLLQGDYLFPGDYAHG